jgi:hypothetical protein
MAGDKPLVQIEEVRSGGSYFSQNDLRIHFGLNDATKAESVKIVWPSGQVDVWKDLSANVLYVLQEGGKTLKSMKMGVQPVVSKG